MPEALDPQAQGLVFTESKGTAGTTGAHSKAHPRPKFWLGVGKIHQSLRRALLGVLRTHRPPWPHSCCPLISQACSCLVPSLFQNITLQFSGTLQPAFPSRDACCSSQAPLQPDPPLEKSGWCWHTSWLHWFPCFLRHVTEGMGGGALQKSVLGISMKIKLGFRKWPALQLSGYVNLSIGSYKRWVTFSESHS